MGRNSSQKTTVSDVAKLAGVSRATAARALGDYGFVSENSRAAVELAAEKLGYKTNYIAQALSSGQSKSIGLIIGDIENPFFATVASNLSDAFEDSGYTLIIGNSVEDQQREKKLLRAMRSNMVAGIVIAPHSGDGAYLQAIVDDGLPIVLIDRGLPNIDTDTVIVDNFNGGYNATTHLLNKGHTRVAVLTDSVAVSSSLDRLDGYYRALKDHALPIDQSLVALAAYERESGYDSARALLERADRPTAIFATNNFMTEGVVRAARDLDISIPHELSLFGFDDDAALTLTSPAISTISQPADAIGTSAAKVILDRVNGDSSEPRHLVLQTTMLIRQSCAAPPRSTI